MANETRLRGNFLSGLIGDSPLLVGATTLNSPGLASLPVVGAAQHLALTLDPSGSGGSPEIVWVTAHSAAATSVTIVRAREGTGARQHANGVMWINAPTTYDVRSNDRTWSNPYPAHALDDEFNDGVLDAAWLRYDRDVLANTYTEAADCLSIYHPGGGTADRMANILAKPLGGISFPVSIEGSFRFFRRYATNYQMFGLCMTDGLAATNRGIWMMPFSNTGTATAFDISVRAWAAIGNSAAASNFIDQNMELVGGPLYMKLRWSAANTFQASFSPDGVGWMRLPATDMSFTLTPTHIGVCMTTWGNATPCIGTVEYFRVVQA